jgi:UDP-N-acetylglucosamine--N-acetylmuramyl-(pentapeptide) pyrophosphoryl-undecaprenol N-acetylglucosamine transferase
MMHKKFIIAGGGTGGHIFPAIAIANAIKKQMNDAVFLFVGAKGKMEMEKVPQAGYDIEGIDIAGFNRSALIKNISLPFKLIKSFIQVAGIFKRFKPDAVIGVGGYSTFPVLKYAQSKGTPTFIHEANSFAGKSNMLLAKKATRVFTVSEGMEKFFPSEKISVSGNPVRESIVNSKIKKQTALNHFGLSPNVKTVLVIGGSLGAKSINEAVKDNLELFEKNNLQLIWQTGVHFYATAKDATAHRPMVFVSDFIQRMDYAYAAADVVISRSGAMSVSELSIVRKPVIFVPYPFAAEDHQTANAMNLVEKNAAMMIADKDAREKLIPAIVDLAKNENKQEDMKINMGIFAIPDADKRVADEIIKILS